MNKQNDININNYYNKEIASQEKKIVVQNKVDQVKDRIEKMSEGVRDLVGKLEDRSHEMLENWRHKSEEFVRNFINMYGTMVRCLNYWSCMKISKV